MKITYCEYGSFRITPSNRWLIEFRTFKAVTKLNKELEQRLGKIVPLTSFGAITYGLATKPTNKQLRRIKKDFYNKQYKMIKYYQSMLDNG